MTTRKGIILAGGSGTRLHPVTQAVSQAAAAGLRQADDLLPAVHADAGGDPRHPDDLHAAGHAALRAAAGRRRAVGAEHLATRCSPSPRGWRRPSSSAATSSADDPCALVLGDNIFYGHDLSEDSAGGGAAQQQGATVFAYPVHDPERYGVVEFDAAGAARSASRKSPRKPKSRYAVTGLYFYDNQVVDIARDTEALAARRAGDHRCQPDVPGNAASLQVEMMGRGMAWLDTGTHESLLEASHVRPDHREAAGAEDRLPGGDRLPHGLSSMPRATARRWPRR